jgi:AcrR family transcriptional regulator
MANDKDSRRVHRGARPDSAAVIRDAALRRFAAQGVAGTTLRLIAADAGVSVGLVQHRFGTKERLVDAVDQYVLEVVQTQLVLNVTRERSAEESVEDTGRRVRGLIGEYPEVVDYLARAMIDDTPIGGRAFDALFEMGRERWGRRADRNQLQADVVDVTWAALNPLLLTLGTIILRRHVERHLPEPFTKPSQLQRWESSVNVLLEQGQMR